MPKRVEFNGVVHEFPDDATEDEIRTTLEGMSQSSGPSMNFAQVNGQRVPVDDSPVDLVRGVASKLNPLSAMQTVGKALIPEAAARQMGASDAETFGPVNALQGIMDAQNAVKQQADAAWSQGDYPTAVRKYTDWLMPVIGPILDQSADKMAQGQGWRGAGEAIGLGLSLALPKAMETARVKVPSVIKPRNTVEQAAVEFGERQGVPIDMATATGNPVIRNIQKATANTPLGARPALAMQADQAAAMTRTGEKLAKQAHPLASTPETAGANINQMLRGKLESHAQYAEHAYQQLESIANDPRYRQSVQVGVDAAGQPVVEEMALPVDLRGVKASFRPLYQSIARSLPVTQRQASAGFQALENIVNGPDFAPLLQTERDLGALKEIARGAELPELRSISQGLGAQGVSRLQAAIDSTAAQAGPTALRSLKEGRAATAEKFATADVWDKIKQEPVQAYRQTTAPKDAGIDLLRTIRRQAPTVTARIGRAWLDEQLTTATSEGSFQRAQRIQNKWQELGPETKKILFPEPGQITALDNFFRLGRMMAENPNPSGTALTGTSLASVQGLFFAPGPTIAANVGAGALSKILNSPKAVRLFNHGTTLMLGPGRTSKIMRSSGIANILRAAREAGVSERAPGASTAQTDQP